MARTRIVATLGPASSTDERLRELFDAGVDVVRLNCAHGSHEEFVRTIEAVRRIAASRPVAILMDLAGPKLRLKHPVSGHPGDVVPLDLPATVKGGDPVLLADGLMRLEVVDPRRCRIVSGSGDIPPGKGINLPSSRLDLPPLTDKDRADLRLATERGADFVALSFVRRASDLDELKVSGIPVVAKIEKAQAVDRLEEIVGAADAVMVARGDLGVEIPIERVPVVQKRIIALANREAKPVITATQMLRSMVDNPQPTRAEATDVANAVLDGSDAVMLSEETAIGWNPAETVRVMERILREAEPLLESRREETSPDVADVMSHAAIRAAERIGAKAIVVLTSAGSTARRVARHRPRIPVIALAPSEAIRRRLSLVWGVHAVTAPWIDQPGAILERFREIVRASGLVPAGASVVLAAGWPIETPGVTNWVHATTV
ncbi:MAG: pyruvate kinase [Planctomycetes bacterium]|nr:pyruvate kinase [Planctomycetota bacterium]